MFFGLLALNLIIDVPAECPAAAFEARMAGILAEVTGEARLEVQHQGGVWVAELALGTGVRRLVGSDCATLLDAVGLSLEVALLAGPLEGGVLEATPGEVGLDAAALRPDAATASVKRPAEPPERPAERPGRPAERPRRPPSTPKRPAEPSKRPPSIPERPAELSAHQPTIPERPAELPARPPSIPERPAELPARPPSIPERQPSSPERPPSIPERPAELSAPQPSIPERPPSIPERPPSIPERPAELSARPPSIPERPQSIPERPPSIPERPPSIPERPAELSERPPSIPERPPSIPERLDARVTAAALADLGTTPGLTAGAVVGFEYPLGPGRLGIEAAWLASAEAATGPGMVHADAFAARLIGCLDGTPVGLCGTATAAFQRVGGEGFDINREAQTPFLSAGVRARHELWLAPVSLWLEAALPLSRTRLRVDGLVVWETSPVVLQLGLGGRFDL